MTGKQSKAEKLEGLGQKVRDDLLEHWDVITRPEALKSHLPEGITASVSLFYDGGVIALKARGTEVMSIEREVEYSRISIAIPSPFTSRSDKLMGLLDRIIPEIVMEQKELDRQARIRAEEEANAPILAVIDGLPDPFD